MTKEDIINAAEVTVETFRGDESYNRGVRDAVESMLRYFNTYRDWSERFDLK